MVEKLVSTAAASDNGKIAFKYSVCKIYNGDLVFLVSDYSVIFKKPLEAGHHFISLGYRILIGLKVVLICKLEDVCHVSCAAVHDIVGKIKIFCLFCKTVQSDDRL